MDPLTTFHRNNLAQLVSLSQDRDFCSMRGECSLEGMVRALLPLNCPWNRSNLVSALFFGPSIMQIWFFCMKCVLCKRDETYRRGEREIVKKLFFAWMLLQERFSIWPSVAKIKNKIIHNQRFKKHVVLHKQLYFFHIQSDFSNFFIFTFLLLHFVLLNWRSVQFSIYISGIKIQSNNITM